MEKLLQKKGGCKYILELYLNCKRILVLISLMSDKNLFDKK